MRRTFAFLAVAATAASLAGAPVASGSESVRVNLLSADTGYLYWSPDASDPELAAPSVSRTCGLPPTWGTAEAAPCLTGIEVPTGFTHTLFFAPGAQLDETIEWTVATRPRFRIALTPAIDAPFTVHGMIQNGTAQIETPAATEVQPGVWEAQLPSVFPIDKVTTTLFGIRVRTRLSRFAFTVGTAGASYVDFAEPIAMRSVPELLAARPEPDRAYTTAQRRFDFNDDDYVVHEFSGDLATTRRFAVTLDETAPVVYAWVESFVDPFVGAAIRDANPDPSRLRDAPVIRLLLDGEEIEGGAHSPGTRGRGMDTAAAVSVRAGRLELEVAPSSSSAGGTYVARILTAGERSIARMRWKASPLDNEPYVTHRLPGSAICPAAGEIVPATSSVSTFIVDVDWETVNPLPERWTLRYILPHVGAYGCGEAGVGDKVRFTVPPAARVWPIGAVLPRDTATLSLRMTTFTYTATFAYA